MITRFTEMQRTLTARWKQDWPKTGNFALLEGAMLGALGAVAQLQAKKDEVKATGRFSAKGIQDEARRIARSETIRPLRLAAHVLEKVKQELAAKRQDLVMVKAKAGDLAGAVIRGEMRQWLRTLGPGQLMSTLLADDVDEQLIFAALEAPAGMSGLTPQMQTQIREGQLARKKGPEIAHLDRLEEAKELVEAALTTSLYQFRQEIDFGENQNVQFDEWMASASREIEIELAAEVRSTPALASLDRAQPQHEQDYTAEIDEIFARALPEVYPDHPVNKQARV